MTTIYTSEFVSEGHPDKFLDQVGDTVLDTVLSLAKKEGIAPQSCRTAIECLAKDKLVIVSGEIAISPDILKNLNINELVTTVWKKSGYEGTPTVLNYIKAQSPEISNLVDNKGGNVASGAGDQGIMNGAAVRETETFMPREYELSRKLALRLKRARLSGEMNWLRSDAKTQISVDTNGEIHSVIISTQHSADVTLKTLRETLLAEVVLKVLPNIDPSIAKINHKGSFVVGGTIGDAGVVGRKLCVDNYGPRFPVGGGAYSGKDPSKVDRSAAYMARKIALAALKDEFTDAQSCFIQLAYGIGQVQPEAIMAIVDGKFDATSWVNDRFPDLSPQFIQADLGLWECDGWSYYDTASYGHYGRPEFPWEQ